MQCPKCHKEIADTVVECPYCHIVVARFLKRQKEKMKNSAKPGAGTGVAAGMNAHVPDEAKKMGRLEWLSLILILVAGLFFYLKATGKYEAKAPVVSARPVAAAKPVAPPQKVEELPKLEDITTPEERELGPQSTEEGIEKVEKLIDRTAPMLPGNPKAVLDKKD